MISGLILLRSSGPAGVDCNTVFAREDKKINRFLCCASVQKMANSADASDVTDLIGHFEFFMKLFSEILDCIGEQ